MHIKRERDLLPLQLHELQLHAKRTRQEEHTAEQQQLQEDNADLPPSHALPWGCQVSVGGRAYQEDAHSVGSLGEDRHLWAVYDGHGGPDVSDFLARNMRQTVSNALALSESCEAALRQAFRESDASLPESSSSQGGSTALVVVVDNKRITCANAGDSRAVLARGGRAVALSCDHKPDNAEEALRIQEAGGTILNTSGVRRVMGVLSMTRAIGDSWLQQYGVTPEPEVRTFDRCDKDELMILASDGLWDVLCNQEAVDVARRCLQRACSKGASRRAASKIAAQVLVRMAADKGSRDNITVIVVDLALPSGSPAATPKPEPQLPAAAKCGEPAVAVVCQTTCSQAATARRHSEPSVACGKSTSGVDTPAWPLQLPRLLSAERLSLLITASSAPPLLILA